MSLSEDYASMEDLHPIDIVESLAEHHAWEFDRVTDDQIAMSVEGQWRTYSLTLAWSAQDETLRLICTFEMEPPEGRLSELYDVLNRCTDMVWTAALTPTSTPISTNVSITVRRVLIPPNSAASGLPP